MAIARFMAINVALSVVVVVIGHTLSYLFG